jgi:hypothetical protein
VLQKRWKYRAYIDAVAYRDDAALKYIELFKHEEVAKELGDAPPKQYRK